MKALTVLLNRISAIPVLIAAVILFVLCIGYVLPRQQAATAVYARETGSVGLSFFLPPDRVYAMAEAYGERGRREYITVWLTYDIVWPLVYALLYVVAINRSLRYVHGLSAGGLSAVALLPLVLDMCENLLAVTIMARYPVRMDAVAWVLAAATSLKWITMGIASCLLAYGVLAVPVCWAARRLRAARGGR